MREDMCILSRDKYCIARGENGVCMLKLLTSEYPRCDKQVSSLE